MSKGLAAKNNAGALRSAIESIAGKIFVYIPWKNRVLGAISMLITGGESTALPASESRLNQGASALQVWSQLHYLHLKVSKKSGLMITVLKQNQV